ncbi:MAG: hypothetical protein ACXVZN_13640, partial [Gaiellaceae bacterium]
MTTQTSGHRRWPAAVLIAVSALVIGAIFGMPGMGHAASQAVPANTALPSISGTPQSGSTLTTDNGTWTGTPTSFTHAWSRCDVGGNTCVPIAGATSQAYLVQPADVGVT